MLNTTRRRTSFIKHGLLLAFGSMTGLASHAHAQFYMGWGNDSYGQVAPEAALVGVKQVAVGGSHAIALQQNGKAIAWGSNDQGQLNVPNESFSEVAAGYAHCIAVTTDGGVRAWGSFNYGVSTLPVTFTNVTTVSTMYWHNLARRSDGSVVAWGKNEYGECNVPGGLVNATKVATGYGHSVALTSDGACIGWGGNWAGQISVPGYATELVDVSCGYNFTVALNYYGGVLAWGENSSGQINVPPGLAGVTSIRAGEAHVVARRFNGSVVAWGYNGQGQTTLPAGLSGVATVAAGSSSLNVACKTNGSIVTWAQSWAGSVVAPAAASNFGQLSDIAAGRNFTVAVRTNGTIFGWGSNDNGQLSFPAEATNMSQVVTSRSFWAPNFVLGIRSDGSILGWGNNDYGQTSVPTNAMPAVQVAAGGSHGLARLSNGNVVGWGRNYEGQSTTPSDLAKAIWIAAAEQHSIAIRSDGQIQGWGASGYGAIPTMNYGYRYKRCSTNVWGTIALTDIGQFVTWGGVPCCPNSGGIFVDVALSSTASSMSQWDPTNFAAALTTDGRVVTWGYGGSTTFAVPSPAGLFGVQKISLGTNHVAAILENCDNDSRSDYAQIAFYNAPDLNNSLTLDTCDIARGWEEDCDRNAVIDSWQQSTNLSFTVESAQLGPIGAGRPRSADLAAPPFAITDPIIEVTAFGDFSLATEYMSVYLNGRFVGQFFNDTWPDKNDCRAPMTRSIGMPRAFYNELIHQGGGATSAIFEFVPSIAVNANQCPAGSWVKAKLSYVAAVDGDCNANGLLDVCEARDFPDTDANRNGIVDSCETYALVFECAGDLDGSGTVDTGDMGILLMNFGPAMPGDPNDLDDSGTVDTADIAMLLLSFGNC